MPMGLRKITPFSKRKMGRGPKIIKQIKIVQKRRIISQTKRKKKRKRKKTF